MVQFLFAIVKIEDIPVIEGVASSTSTRSLPNRFGRPRSSWQILPAVSAASTAPTRACSQSVAHAGWPTSESVVVSLFRCRGNTFESSVPLRVLNLIVSGPRCCFHCTFQLPFQCCISLGFLVCEFRMMRRRSRVVACLGCTRAIR